MAQYMFQLAYTSDAWKAMIANPQNRLEAIRPLVEGLGGSVQNAWVTFGEYDAVVIFDLPDNVSAAAFAAIVAAGGAARAARTTPLLSIEDAVAAAEKAKGVSNYRPPSA